MATPTEKSIAPQGYIGILLRVAGAFLLAAILTAFAWLDKDYEYREFARWLFMVMLAASASLGLYVGIRLLIVRMFPATRPFYWHRAIVQIMSLSIVVFVGIWLFSYAPNDNKSLQYTLWKVDLYPLNLDDATDAFWSDPEREEFVVGKTERQLREKFGYLNPISKMTPNFQECYREVANGEKAFFIRDSWLMIVFKGDKAVGLILMKPC